MEEQRAIFSVLEYLEFLKRSNQYDTENIEVALQCLSTAFSMDPTNEQKKAELGLQHHSLSEIFRAGCDSLKIDFEAAIHDPAIEKNRELWNKWLQKLNDKGFFQGTVAGSEEYVERMKKALAKFKEKFSTSENEQTNLSQEEKEQQAEEIKKEGNIAMAAKDYVKAAGLYEQAANLCPNGPNSHIYYANFAAAEIHLGKYEESIKHCEESIKLNGNYVKAYSRLGSAYYHLKELDLAIDSYHRGLEVDSCNAACMEGLEEVEHLKETESAAMNTQTTAGDNSQRPNPGMPDMSNLAGMMGGAGGLAGLLNNPQMQKMAASMMQNPEMKQMAENMMSNPSSMNDMLRNLGQGGVGGSSPSPAAASPSVGGSATTNDSSSGGSGLSSLLSPEGIQTILKSPKMQELRKDPEMSDFFQDLDTKGPSGVMSHLTNAKVLSKLKTLLIP